MNLRLKLFALTASICGVFTSLAVEPVAVWSGDFNETTKGNYTLSANDNTVAVDGSSITISTTATKGVLVDISPASTTGKTTLIVKYSGLSTPSSNAVLLSGAMNSQIKDLVGVAVKADGSISNIWDNNADNRGSVDSSVAVPQAGIVAFTYDGNNSTASNKGGAFYVKTASGMARKAQSLGSLFSTGNPVNGFAIGGKRASGSLGVIPGLVIEGVAIFASVLSTTDMAAYEFPQKLPGVISLNICNGLTADAGAVLAETETMAGTIPANAWQNICNTTENNLRQGTKTGIVAWTGSQITTLADASVTWSCNGNDMANLYKDVTTTIPFLKCYYSRANQSGLNGPVTFTITGIPYSSYDVIVYLSGNSAEKNPNQSIRVNDSLYYGGTVDAEHKYGTYAGSSTSWGMVANQNAVEYGKNVIRVEGQTSSTAVIKLDSQIEKWGIAAIQIAENQVMMTKAELSYDGDVKVSDINNDLKATDNKAEVTLTAGATVYVDETPAVPTKLICEGAITLSASTKPDLSKFDLSGVTGGIVRTWLTEAEKKGIGFNFAKGCGPNTADALVETVWYDNAKENNGTNKAFSSDGLTTITYTSKNIYNDAGNQNDDANGTLVKGYLDDGNGDGVQITVKNVPFAEYAVIIYASTDQGGKTLSFKKVNGTNYTYDSAHSDIAKVGEDAWGACQSSSSISYGRNAIRVIEQTAGILTIESKRDDSKNVRGCISAIQIVPYSSFVAPTATIASVESKCSEDYKSNMITGVLSDCDLHSWTGDLTARVVVDSKVYESAAIEDNKFTIEVSDLKQATVYRTVLEVGYTDGETFNAIATKAIALYQGEQKFVWIASPFKIQDATLVNEAQGLTIGKLFESPDYVDLCDSEYTVSISASEAVDAENDAALDGTEQGGIRIAQTTGGLKLQVVDKGDWVDFADAAVNTTYTLKVKFHYAKSQEGETDATSVTYTLDSTSKTSANTTGKQKVTEIFVSDGTNLAEDLFGACQLDSAVIVDIELKPGEGDAIDYNTEAEANAAIKTLKIGICDAVKNVLTTETQQATYRSYFHLVVVPSKMLENGFSVKTEFTTEAKSEIEKELETALSEVVNAFNSGSAKIVGKPGLYYGVKRGDSLEAMSVQDDLQMAGADGKVTISITKPEGAAAHFYRIIVSPTPATK